MRIGALSEYVLISINTEIGQCLGIIFAFQLGKKNSITFMRLSVQFHT
jgi:hypothetical protein